VLDFVVGARSIMMGATDAGAVLYIIYGIAMGPSQSKSKKYRFVGQGGFTDTLNARNFFDMVCSGNWMIMIRDGIDIAPVASHGTSQ